MTAEYLHQHSNLKIVDSTWPSWKLCIKCVLYNFHTLALQVHATHLLTGRCAQTFVIPFTLRELQHRSYIIWSLRLSAAFEINWIICLFSVGCSVDIGGGRRGPGPHAQLLLHPSWYGSAEGPVCWGTTIWLRPGVGILLNPGVLPHGGGSAQATGRLQCNQIPCWHNQGVFLISCLSGLRPAEDKEQDHMLGRYQHTPWARFLSRVLPWLISGKIFITWVNRHCKHLSLFMS